MSLEEELAAAAVKGVKKIAPKVIKKVKEKLPKAGKKALDYAIKHSGIIKDAYKDLHGKSLGTAATNLAIRGITGRRIKEDGYPGESHGVVEMSDGSLERAQFLGPGTQVIKRLQLGQKGKTPVDRIARRHDIDYSLATTTDEVKAADKRMVHSLRALKKGEDRIFNIVQGKLMIPKMLAEKITGKTYFNDMKGPRNQTEKLILLKALK